MGVAESATPFHHWIIDDWCLPVSIDLRNQSRWEVEYANELERGKRTSRDVEGFGPNVAEVFRELRDPDTVNEWAERTGIVGLMPDPLLHGAGLHLLNPGGWLQTHLDYAIHPKLPQYERRLSLIVFLTPTWRKEWGGQLLLSDPMGKPVAEIDPVPGRLVAFECGDLSFHGVRKVGWDAFPRISAAVYYLSPARPGAVRQRAMYFPNRNPTGCPQEVE
jgi:hypothetical protein